MSTIVDIPKNLEQTRYLAQLDPDLLRIDIVKSVTLFRLIFYANTLCSC